MLDLQRRRNKPLQALDGFIPEHIRAECSSKVPTIELHREQIREAKSKPRAMNEHKTVRAQNQPIAVSKGQKVLAGRNQFTHHSSNSQIVPKRYGLFKVI